MTGIDLSKVATDILCNIRREGDKEDEGNAVQAERLVGIAGMPRYVREVKETLKLDE